MRTALFLVAALAVLAGLEALAGETLLGKLQVVTDGGTLETTNASTATPFYVAPAAKITIYCDQAAYLLTDSASATTMATGSNPGLPVSALEKFPTSVGTMVRFTSVKLPDGGWTPINGAALNGAVVRVLADAGTTCPVFERRGTE